MAWPVDALSRAGLWTDAGAVDNALIMRLVWYGPPLQAGARAPS